MHMNILTVAEYSEILSRLDSLSKQVELLKNSNSFNRQIRSVKETCDLINVSPRTLQRYRDLGKIGFTQVGSKILFTADHIQAFMAANNVEPFNPRKHGK